MSENQATKENQIIIIKKKIDSRHIVIFLIASVLLFQFLLYFVFQAEINIKTLMKIKADRKKLLYVFLAVGTHPERNEIIKNNIVHIVMKNQDDDKYQVDCLILGYADYYSTPTWLKEIDENSNSPCKYIKSFKERYVYFFKYIPSFYLERSGYSYITFVLDDVVHYPPHGNFDLRGYFDIIFQNDLEIVAPAVVNSYWSKFTGPRPITNPEVGRIASFLEIQTLTLKPYAWRCFDELLDTEFPSGWGVDLWFYNYCVVDKKVVKKELFAVIDKYYVHHNPDSFSSTHQGMNENLQIDNWIEVYGIDLRRQYPIDNLGMLYYYEDKK
jgi:hypothetical protein